MAKLFMTKMRMSMKILVPVRICLILLFIRLSQKTMTIQTNHSLEKWKMKPEVLRLKNLTTVVSIKN